MQHLIKKFIKSNIIDSIKNDLKNEIFSPKKLLHSLKVYLKQFNGKGVLK